jgi:hypothetical protein
MTIVSCLIIIYLNAQCGMTLCNCTNSIKLKRPYIAFYIYFIKAHYHISSLFNLIFCKDFYPFTITHILTDNGLEFTDKFVTKDKQVSGKHKFDKLCSRSEIEHRLTQPH